MLKKHLCSILLAHMVLAHAFTITLQNHTSEPIRTWARPSDHACLYPLWQNITPGETIQTECDLTSSFYAAITFYPMQIYPQYITLALPAWGRGAMPNVRVIGCTAIPYQCHVDANDHGLTFTLSNR